MYAYLSGIIDEKLTDRLVIDVNGIGYNVLIPAGRYDEIPNVGEKCKIYTYTCVREDALMLFGFMSKDELEMFRLLITVSGVGPKAGQALLSDMRVPELRSAILLGDVKRISGAQGIGKKTAERIVVDLQDKISKEEFDDADRFVNGNTSALSPAGDKAAGEAVAALCALGYSQKDATAAVNAALNEPDIDKSRLLNAALKYM